MVINPYADQIDLPAGTPTSVINTILNIRAQAQANAQRQAYLNSQNDPWATGLNNVLNNVLTPYIQKQFIDLPYQEDLYNYRTNEDIRKAQELANSADMTSQRQAIFKRAQDYSGLTDFGNAIGDYTNAIQPQTTLENYSFQNPMGPQGTYNDQYIDYPGNPSVPTYVQKPPTNIQGDLASTGQTPLETTTTESKTTQPSTADAFRLIAGQNPLNAGILAQAFEKNANLANLLDPLKQKERESGIATKEAQAQSGLARIQDLLAQTQSKIDLRQAQTGAAEANTLRYDALAKTEIGKQMLRDKAMDPNTTEEEFKKIMTVLSGKPAVEKTTDTRSFMTEFATQKGMAANEGKSDQEIREITTKVLRDRKIEDDARARAATSAAGLSAVVAAKEIPDIHKSQAALAVLDSHISKLGPAVEVAHDAGILPNTPTTISDWKTKIQRQNPQAWADPTVQRAIFAIAQFYPGAIVTYDRDVIDMKGGRMVKEAYNLPGDSTLLPYAQLREALDFMTEGSNVAKDIASIRERALLGAASQGGVPATSPLSRTPQAQTGKRIRVRQKSTGNTGSILESDFNPAMYERLSE